MKIFHIFFLGIFLLFSLSAYGQGRNVLVKMKGGTEISGTLKAMNVSTGVTVVVAGIETSIPMNEIASIEELPIEPMLDLSAENSVASAPLIVTDEAQYPESIDIVVGGVQLHMILVRGGSFMMGYDGRHSLSMNSEPVHKVNLSSYYVATKCLTNEIIKNLGIKISATKKPNDLFIISGSGKTVDEMLEMIAKDACKRVRLITEAEWEYAFRQNAQVLNPESYEICYDYFDDYPSSEQTNPTGSTSVKRFGRVFRSYDEEPRIYARTHMNQNLLGAAVRLVISASDL